MDCELINPNSICPAIWAPVCGCDGVTYGNDCEATNQGGVTSFTEGECPQNNVSPCMDLSGIDFGACAAVIGYASVNGEAVAISGCGTLGADNVDYAAAFYLDAESVTTNCLCPMDSVPESVNDLTQFSLLIGASPVEDELQIFYASAEEYEIELLDITGRSVLESRITSGTYTDVSALGNGLYILILKQEDEAFYSTRVVIKR